MSSNQPMALRLADVLKIHAVHLLENWTGKQQELVAASAELRRLHAEVEREHASRQAAQVENDALKARLARAGLEQQRAVLAERERCAKLCDSVSSMFAVDGDDGNEAADYCAEQIRKGWRPTTEVSARAERVRSTAQLGAFFTAEMLKNATMTELAEARAKRGYCPKCQVQKLRHTHNGAGRVFRHCVGCGTVVVLPSA